MKIVVLDGLPLNPGDLDWAPLHAAGELVVYGTTAADEVVERIAEADIVAVNKVRLTAEALACGPRLRLITVMATGYDCVDLAAAQRQGITVCNVPAYSAEFTAQTAVALLLELTHHAGAHDAAVRAGEWARAGTFGFWKFPLVELAGKTLVIVGLGNIGRRVAAVAAALGMRVVAAQWPGRPDPSGPYETLPLDAALAQADAISLHCPLTPETRQFMNADRLGLLKPGTLLVNTARGLLVDEAAVADALRAGPLAGYACDVLPVEPPSPDNPLLSAPNCLITPHLGWASPEARRRCLDVTAANAQAFLAGMPQNVVG